MKITRNILYIDIIDSFLKVESNKTQHLCVTSTGYTESDKKTGKWLYIWS